jgi:hypothetical protein
VAQLTQQQAQPRSVLSAGDCLLKAQLKDGCKLQVRRRSCSQPAPPCSLSGRDAAPSASAPPRQPSRQRRGALAADPEPRAARRRRRAGAAVRARRGGRGGAARGGPAPAHGAAAAVRHRRRQLRRQLRPQVRAAACGAWPRPPCAAWPRLRPHTPPTQLRCAAERRRSPPSSPCAPRPAPSGGTCCWPCGSSPTARSTWWASPRSTACTTPGTTGCGSARSWCCRPTRVSARARPWCRWAPLRLLWLLLRRPLQRRGAAPGCTRVP